MKSKRLVQAAAMLCATFMLAGVDAADSAKLASPVTRDWRLSDLRQAIKASGKNLPAIITGITIKDEDTLIVYLVATRQPLSGAGAEATLKFSRESGWQVTRTAFFDR